MNHTRFNLNRFNQGSGESLIVLTLRMTETINGLFIVSDITNYTQTFYEAVSADTRGFAGCLKSGIFSEGVDGQAEVIGVKAPREMAAELNEGVETSVMISEVRNLETESAEAVNADVELYQVQYGTISFVEVIEGSVSVGNESSRSAEFFEVISAISEAEANEERVLTLNITLRPGEKLIIDSENYNVLIVSATDGSEINAIHTHSGDWIDALSRDTRSLHVESGTTRDLLASILYTERFL